MGTNLLELATMARDEHGAIQWPHELAAATAMLPQPLNRVLEIGTLSGGTLWYWSQVASPDAQILSIDIEDRGVHVNPLGAQTIETFVAPSTSGEAMRKVATFFDGPLDLLYIDGDHTHEQVECDFNTYVGLMRTGGVVMLDDITHDNMVEIFWKKLEGNYHRVSIFPDSQLGRGVIPTQPLNRFGVGLVFV
jgi:cephalosporin hydroxylase